MWLFTTFGFFSIVRKSGDEHLTIRGRTRGDLERLRRCYLQQASAPLGGGGTDYPWRVRCAPEELAAAMPRIVRHLDYANFKDEVVRCLGKDRSHRYHQVWSALYGMGDDLPDPAPEGWQGLPWAAAATPGKAPAFGGVVVDAHGRLLLREVANHWDGYVWTFAKGRPDKGEAPRQTALREVREEMGVETRILYALHGSFAGGTTVSHFFLMPVDAREVDLGFHCRETARLRWALPEEARELIGQTSNAKGRVRDLQILDAALAALPSPVPLRQPIARVGDWACRPMPARSAVLPFERTLSPGEMARLAHGVVPRHADDVWFVYLEDGVLRCHRSQTGFEVFRARLAPVAHGAGQWRFDRVEVNRHKGQVAHPDEAQERTDLNQLIDHLLFASEGGRG